MNIVEIDQLINELEDDKKLLTTLLKKTQKIIYATKDRELEQLIKCEESGNFTDENLPEYRYHMGEPFIAFKNGLGHEYHERVNEWLEDIKKVGVNPDKVLNQSIILSISTIETALAENKQNSFKIQFSVSQKEVIIGRYEVANPAWKIDYGYFKFHNSVLQNILHGARTNIIKILLRIKGEYFNGETLINNGESYLGYKAIQEIVDTAKRKIILIDNYIDGSSLAYFQKKELNDIRIITSKTSINANFKLALENFNKQYNNLEVKLSKKFHDRYIVIDDKTCYIIGSSIKDVGHKVSTISKINDESMKKALLEKIKIEWNN